MTTLTNAERQFEEWVDVFNITRLVEKEGQPEIELWSRLSDKYILVERVDLEELVKMNTPK
jgi:hypothetical protein